jgi:hypothetical protein
MQAKAIYFSLDLDLGLEHGRFSYSLKIHQKLRPALKSLSSTSTFISYPMDVLFTPQKLLAATLMGGVVGGIGYFLRKTQRFITIMSMGLSKKRRRPGKSKAHSIIDLRALKPPSTSEGETVVQQYLSVIGNRRSIRSTMSKQVPKAVLRHGISLRTNKGGSLGLDHFRVLYSHEASVRGRGAPTRW